MYHHQHDDDDDDDDATFNTLAFWQLFLCEIFTLRPLDDVTFTLDDIIVQHMRRFWVISAANNCATVWCAIVESIASNKASNRCILVSYRKNPTLKK